MLKRSIYILLFFLLFAQFVKAQYVYFPPEHHIGISGGPSASMVLFTPTVSQTYLLNYTGGLVYRYINEKHLGLQVELNYSQRGWKEANDRFTKQIDYIELPFMSHFYFGDKARFFFNIGPKVGYLIQEKILHQENPASTEKQHTQGVKNKFEYGAALGFGGMFRIKNQLIQLEVRGNYNANGIYPNDSKEHFRYSNIIHASVTLGWQICLSDKR